MTHHTATTNHCATRALRALVVISALLCSACGGGGGILLPPTPGDFLIVVAADGTASVSAGPGAADAGTTVSLAAPGSGTGTADADGSVAFTGVAPTGGPVGVEHTRGGQPVTATETVTSLASLVDTTFAATGSAPNDLLFSHGSLYVANSLDNTVTRYATDGSLAATGSFPAGASPSYLELGEFDDILWVSRNGDNTISGLDPTTLVSTGQDLLLDHPGLSGLAFSGPGRVQAYDLALIVPLAAISAFGTPTLFDSAGVGLTLPLESTDKVRFLDEARNGQTAEIIPTTAFSVVVSAGEIQFDAAFTPSATTSSHLAICNLSSGGSVFPLERATLDLGLIGASSIAISPDGKTAYLGNLINGNLYKVDLSDLDNPAMLRGAANPITLTSEFTFVSDVAFTPDGSLLLATSFNTDELYVIDPSTDTVNPVKYPAPFDLSLSPDLLAGCQAVETNGDKAWVLYSIANAVAEVDLF